jgi:ribosomal-protein-alanine N-acetyltransferase
VSATQAAPTVVRRATFHDLLAVADMERRCYADPWSPSSFASLPENPAVYFAVAPRADGTLAGYVIAWHVLDEAELANLAVDPATRRAGVGAQLLDSALDEARQRGTSRVYLEVRESNVAARRLYASRGFAEIGRRKKYYRSPEEDALILRRELLGGAQK